MISIESVVVTEHKLIDCNFRGENVVDSCMGGRNIYRPLSDVLQNIQSALKEHKPETVKINFSENYLSVTGLEELKEFLNQPLLVDRLEELNLSSNKLDEKAFPHLREILIICPRVSIDISSNPISLRELRSSFNSDDLQRLICS